MKTYNQLSQSAVYREDEISASLTVCGGSYGGGSEVLVVTYQKVTGTLNPGGHPGSYNGQDAYNDMLVIDDESNVHRERSSQTIENAKNDRCFELYARSASSFDSRGGY